jgi:hypothetical protein
VSKQSFATKILVNYEGTPQTPPYITSLGVELGIVHVRPNIFKIVIKLAIIDDFSNVGVQVASGQASCVLVVTTVGTAVIRIPNDFCLRPIDVGHFFVRNSR